MNARFFAIAVACAVFFFVIELIRRQKMTFKYALGWLAGSALVLGFAIFDQALRRIATAAGFVLTSNFVFFLLLVFFVLLSLSLTVYINEQNTRSEQLAQKLGTIELKLKKLLESRS
ncbi:MAG: DUF2304 domain-containing protein [Candidatus Omnitrophota bacterium]